MVCWTAGAPRTSSSTMVIDKTNYRNSMQCVVVDRWWWFASLGPQACRCAKCRPALRAYLAILCTMAPLDSSLFVADLNGWLFCPRQREFLKCCLNSQFCWRETFTLFLEQGATTDRRRRRGGPATCCNARARDAWHFHFQASDDDGRWSNPTSPAFNQSKPGRRPIDQSIAAKSNCGQTKSLKEALRAHPVHSIN